MDDQSERASVIRDDARELYKFLTEELQSLLYENVLYWNKGEAVTPDDLVEHEFREQRRIELRAELYPDSIRLMGKATARARKTMFG